MRITQGCFSFLPDLTDEQITAQVAAHLGCSPAEVDRMDLESGIEWVLMLRDGQQA